MNQVDLHFHSTASDGKYKPAELIAKAAALGLKVIALTDHDSIEGIAPAMEAVKAYPDLTFIAGWKSVPTSPTAKRISWATLLTIPTPSSRKSWRNFAIHAPGGDGVW